MNDFLPEIALLSTVSTNAEEQDAELVAAPLMLNTFLSNLHSADFCSTLILSLLDKNFSPEFNNPDAEFNANSPITKKKVSMWQTLCILHKFIVDERQVNEKAWKVLHLKNFGSVRYCITVCGKKLPPKISSFSWSTLLFDFLAQWKITWYHYWRIQIRILKLRHHCF